MNARWYGWLADLVLVVHLAWVLFVVLGLVPIWIGYFCRWKWVRNFYFRAAHLLAMAIVVAESLLGWICPFTEWEAQLRLLAGEGQRYAGSFIQHWIHRFIFFEIGEQVLTVLYVTFFGLMLLSWWVVRPVGPGK